MKVKINPSLACGNVTAPPSKSIAHRSIICGALSGGSNIENVAYSKDIKATINCLSALGASFTSCEDTLKVGGLDIFNVNEMQF